MKLDATPALDPALERELLDVLADASLDDSSWHAAAWRRAALQEGVERDFDDAPGYAFSPRSTRGATRA